MRSSWKLRRVEGDIRYFNSPRSPGRGKGRKAQLMDKAGGPANGNKIEV